MSTLLIHCRASASSLSKASIANASNLRPGHHVRNNPDICKFVKQPRKESKMDTKRPDNGSGKREKILPGDFMPKQTGRPSHPEPIGKDEILNLTILLNTTGSVDDFLSHL